MGYLDNSAKILGNPGIMMGKVFLSRDYKKFPILAQFSFLIFTAHFFLKKACFTLKNTARGQVLVEQNIYITFRKLFP